jgi:hypothetical protein
MSWIQTFSGKRFEPLDPAVDSIDVVDIAHALSQLCRFGGHCRVFYSVAEHCVRASRIVAPELRLWALLHDAAEAYLADVPRPLKQRIPEYHGHEDRLLKRIAQRFRLPWPIPAAVFDADDRMLATEARDLMAPPPAPWGLTAQPLAETIVPWTAVAAERAFLDAFEQYRVHASV